MSEQDTAPTPSQVIDFLKQNEGFFLDHSEALNHIKLPSEQDGAVSLIEYQLRALRSENTELKKEMVSILTHAKENQTLLDDCASLVVSLIQCPKLPDFVKTLEEQLVKEFHIDHATLVLTAEHFKAPKSKVRLDALETLQNTIGQHFFASSPLCGPIGEQHKTYLFGENTQPQSAALIGLEHQSQKLGILALASNDPDKFRSDMGTLFLSFLARVINQMLQRWAHDK